jgi:hypothetical protein
MMRATSRETGYVQAQRSINRVTAGKFKQFKEDCFDVRNMATIAHLTSVRTEYRSLIKEH